MIWFTLALATTPEDVSAALPAARTQLEACAERCTPAEGAQAAFVVAIGTYVDTGVADGALAATVQALDPGLFAKLPPVLQEAASDPLPWAVAPARTEAPAVLPGLPLPWPVTLTVKVQDAAGKPVPDASMQIVGEGLSRGLDAEGTWTGGGIWVTDPLAPIDGKNATHIAPRYFEKGEAVQVLVTAPGHAPVKATVVLTKNPKKNVFTLVMKPG